MAEDDELWNIKNAFYLGCYQQCISEALSVRPGSNSQTQCKFYMYRSYIQQGQYQMVNSDVGVGAPMMLQAAAVLSSYMGGDRDAKEMALVQLKEWLSHPNSATEPQLLIVAAIIFSHERDYKEALKLTMQSTNLEAMSLVVSLYLSMSRVDLARKQVGLMQQQDDDATLTKLANAYVSMAEGPDKAQDALYEFQELGEKYNMSLMLTNGMVLANLHMSKYEDAERLLQESLSKSATDVDTLANIIVCMQHLRKPVDVTTRYMNQLRSVAPTHPYITKYTELEASFDRCAAQYSAA